ncbi:MAG: hypothetical protein JXB10_20510 [Pirellulales bacterium]|nr:hypothetical protein [Pirellulales bacterium]
MLPTSLSDRWNWLMRAMSLGISVLVLTAVSADAGFLLTDPEAEIQGVKSIFGMADVEYAVYDESAPDLNLNFEDSYIYAFQIFNSPYGMPIQSFNMGILVPDPGINVIDFVADPLDTGGISVIPTACERASSQSLRWLFNSPNIDCPGQSKILFYTSPHGPDGETVGSIDFGNEMFPCPSVPEPGTGTLVILGVISLFLVRAARRTRG